MMNRRSFRVAFCGVTAGLMAALMLLGTMFPMSAYICPMLAGALMIPVIWELGAGAGWMLYIAVSLLSLILAPDKEAALLFALLLGWYPVLRPRLMHIRQRPLRVAVKLVLFNAAVCAVYALLLFVFVSPDLQAESANWTIPILAGMLVLGNAAFLVYDLLLARLTDRYVKSLRPKLFSRLH
jgi:hypothetical protein